MFAVLIDGANARIYKYFRITCYCKNNIKWFIFKETVLEKCLRGWGHLLLLQDPQGSSQPFITPIYADPHPFLDSTGTIHNWRTNIQVCMLLYTQWHKI